MREICILLTGCGSPGANGVINCLKKNGERKINIIGVDMNEDAYGKALVDKFYKVPSANSEEFIPKILDLCLKEKVTIIIPAVTKELEQFSKNKEIFEKNNIKISVMDLDILSIVNNKGKLLNKLQEIGIKTAKYELAKNIQEVEKSIKSLGYPDNSVFIKPTFGNGSRGTRLLDNSLSKYELFFSQKPNSYLIEYEELLEILSEKKEIPEMMIMEYLPGTEYSVDILAENGEVLAIACRKSLKILSSIQMDSIIEKNEKLEEICKEIVRKLKLSGVFSFDVKENEKGESFILEMNPRLPAGIVLTAIAGYNMPYLEIKRLLGEKIEVGNLKYGTKMIRHWEEKFFDEENNFMEWK